MGADRQNRHKPRLAAPFELTSVLLVIAVVATVLLARKPRPGELTVESKAGGR